MGQDHAFNEEQRQRIAENRIYQQFSTVLAGSIVTLPSAPVEGWPSEVRPSGPERQILSGRPAAPSRPSPPLSRARCVPSVTPSPRRESSSLRS